MSKSGPEILRWVEGDLVVGNSGVVLTGREAVGLEEALGEPSHNGDSALGYPPGFSRRFITRPGGGFRFPPDRHSRGERIGRRDEEASRLLDGKGFVPAIYRKAPQDEYDPMTAYEMVVDGLPNDTQGPEDTF